MVKFEEILEKKCLEAKRSKERAYICSPLRADTIEDFMLNMRAAKAYMYYALVKMDLPARAPHAFLPMLLCDAVPKERETALQFGLKLLEMSDTVLVCGNRISEGMLGEIAYAAALKKEIRVYEKSILDEVVKIVLDNHGDINKLVYDKNNRFMSLSGSAVFAESWDSDTSGGE